MPETIKMNKNLAAHILLDPELQGRAGLQGSHFETTVGYLNQFLTIYFNEHQKTLPSSFQQLRQAMTSMVEFERCIRKVNGETVSADSSKKDPILESLKVQPDKSKQLELLDSALLQAIEQLKIGAYLLIPGGWGNQTTSGHAMIYQFTKTKDGLQFSIYNSGAGINFHEKTSSSTTERYYPVRTHNIPKTYNPTELKVFIKQLLLSKLPNHKREHASVNETLLYHDIDKSLVFLDAIPTLASQTTPIALTTAGQVSGTCAQRVLHQILKITFGALPEYQQFIFQFKMHALRELIASSEKPPDQATVDLVLLSIKHITKLLKQLHGVEKPATTKAYLAELSALKKQFKPLESHKAQHHMALATREINTPLSIQANLPSIKHDEAADRSKTSAYTPLIKIDASKELFPQLDTLIALCESKKSKQPSFVIEQLEQAIASLPLPPSFDRKKLGDFQTYAPITDHPETIQKMVEYLEQLQHLYTTVYTAHYPHHTARRSQQQIVQATLIGLRDFFHFQSLAADANTYHAHSNFLKDVFRAYDHSPYLGANTPIFDEKYDQILALYHTASPISYDDDDEKALYDYYKTLLTNKEKQTLLEIYTCTHGRKIDRKLDLHLSSYGLEPLYTLFKLFDQIGNFEEESWADIENIMPQDQPAQVALSALKNGGLKKFSQQITLEKFFKTSLSSFSLSDEQYTAPKLMGEAEYRDQFRLRFNHAFKSFQHAKNRKYALDESPEQKALNEDAPSFYNTLLQKIEDPNNYDSPKKSAQKPQWRSNRIQLSASGLSTKKDTVFIRDLLHLRTSSAHQIQLTLSYFKKSIHHLADKNTQQYVEANLFEHNRLNRLLRKDQAGFLLQFDAFIHTGLQFFLNHQALITQSSIFFIHLRFFVNQYLAKNDPEQAYQRLTQDFHELSALIQMPHDDAIKASLHQYRFLTAMELHALQSEPTPEFLSEAIQSFFAIQTRSNPFIINNIDTTIQLERAKYHMQGWLEKLPEPLLKENIFLILETAGIDITHSTLEGHYPHFSLSNPKKRHRFDIDMASGYIFQDGRRLSTTPQSIKEHILAKRFGLQNETTCFISPDQTLVEFITPHQQIRIKHTHDNLMVEKKWTIEGHAPQWYRLCPLSEKQNTNLQLGAFDKSLIQHNLPDIFDDARITVWVCSEDNSFIIAKDAQAIYKSNEIGEIEQLDAEGKRTGYFLSTYHDKFSKALANFENPEQIITLHKDADWSFVLPRYDLTLETQGDNLQLSGTQYTLTDLPSPIPDSVACLNLSNGQDHQILVAVQPLQLEKVAPITGDYYPLTHDRLETSHNISQYDPEEKYITYKIINGKPSPDTPADALYLCYLYLSSKQPEKAWAVLSDLNGLACTYSELVFLEWIINKLPIKANEDSFIKNPSYLACQLKALALLTDNLAEDKKPPFPDEKLETPCQKEIKTFYQALPETIGNLLTSFQNMERSLSHPFFIKNQERRSLLNTYQRLRLDDVSQIKIDNNFKLVGALGYQYQRLSLETLLKEKNHIEVIKKTLEAQGKPLPSKFMHRLAEIDKKLTKELRILNRQSSVEVVTLPVKNGALFHDLGMSLRIAPSLSRDIIQTLRSDMTESEFLTKLPEYLFIALNQSKTSPASVALREFCMRHARASAHPASFIKNSSFEAITNVLYLLLHAKDPVKTLIKQEIHDAQKSWGGYTLHKLYDALAHVTPEPIVIYQAKDVFKRTLANNQQIIVDLNKAMPAAQTIELTPLKDTHLVTMANFRNKLKTNLSDYSEFETRYKQAETDYQIAFQAQLNQLNTRIDRIDAQIDSEHTAELEAGILKFNLAQQQKAAAEYFSSQARLETLKKMSQTAQDAFTHASEKTWDEALKLANQPPEQSVAAYLQDLEKIAGLRRETLTKKELIKLYFNADANAYIEGTGLTLEQSTALHQRIHRAITQGVETAHLNRLIMSLSTAKPEESASIAATLMSENQSDAQNDPGLMVFQHQENILLREKQCLALKNLLSKTPGDIFQFTESIEKVIMGGGKSKVILPLLAQKKANGHSLVFVEVPRPLLKTNHADLNKTSQQLFDQKAHCFEFNRSSNCSPERLEDLYNQFIASMTDKSYWVTTGEAIQSLELKYLELLLSGRPYEHPDVWEKQVDWMGKITTLVREFGDVVIDEVHQGLLLKKELNYSLGEPEAVDPALREHSIKLYQFIHLISKHHLPKSDTPVLRAEAMRSAWEKSLNTLTDDFIKHEQSPLRPIIKTLKETYGNDVEEHLRAYLNNEKIWDEVYHLDPSLQDTLAFYKEQLSSLLPHTLVQKHTVAYGPSGEKRNANVTERVLAVPYVANSQPSDSSDFGNVLTKLNYTVQSLLIDGLNEALLKTMVTEWLKKARLELQKDPSLETIQNTSIAKGVNHCLKSTGFQLESINVKDEQKMTHLLDKVRFNSDFIFKMLENNILEKITIEPNLLHSNALNHVDLYHSVQGISGTPYNVSTYHSRAQFNRNTALGTDGYLIKTLKHKQTAVHAIEFTQLNDFLPKLFASVSHPKPRAIIDVGAMFTGIKNLEVALSIAQFWDKKDKSIQFILYFNQDNVLCALNVHNQTIITLASSNPDEINQKLGCKPEQRFTYYDQAHTVGTDLKQASDSAGVVLMDQKTPIQSFLQGAMRMRGLEDNQSIEIITPTSLAQHSLENLIDLMTETEQLQLREENYHAAIAKMDNIVRNDLIQKILALPPDAYAEKEQYANAFKDYFVQPQRGRLFDKYGEVLTPQNTDVLLNKYRAQLLRNWFTCLRQVDPTLHPNTEALDQIMQKVIGQALPLCPKTIMAQGASPDQEAETQLQKENQILIEQQKELMKVITPQTQYPQSYSAWGTHDLLKYLKHQKNPSRFMPLNLLCGSDATSLFSSQLLVSNNHAYTTPSQTQMLNPNLKPIHTLLFSLHEGELKACFITNEEARDLDKLLQNSPFKESPIWLSDSQHTLLAGKRPSDVLQDDAYLTVIEQARFFNGDFALLNQQKEPLQWANQDGQSKIQFYQKHLSPYRTTVAEDFALFESKISKQAVGIRHLRAHRFKPLEIVWETLLPNALTADITTLKNLSFAFDEVNRQSFDAPDLELDFLLQKHAIPLEAISELQTHMELYSERKHLWTRFKTKLNFEKMPLEKINTCLDLIKLISTGKNNSLRFNPETTVYFFRELDKLEANEWENLIKSPHFQTIAHALSHDQFIALCMKSVDTIDMKYWDLMLSKLPFEQRYSFLKLEDLDIHKKTSLIKPGNFYAFQETTLIDAIPSHQFNKIVLSALRNFDFSRDILDHLAQKTSHPTLKTTLLVQKNSMTTFLRTLISNMCEGKDRHTSGEESMKRQALKNLLDAFENPNTREEIQKLNPKFLLQTIQAICEHKRHGYNSLWQPQSITEYKNWLNTFNASELFVTNNPSMTKLQLERIAKSNAPFSILLNWQPSAFKPVNIDDISEDTTSQANTAKFNYFEDYLAKISALQTQFPEHKQALQTLIDTVRQAEQGDPQQFDITCRIAIDQTKHELEQETGLWQLLKPLLNGIISLLKHYHVYQGTFFTSNATKAWQEKQLDIAPKKQDEGEEDTPAV